MKGLFVPLGLDSWPGYHGLRIPGEWGINSCLVAAPNVPFFYSLACILTTCHWIWKLLHNSSVMLLRQLSVGVWKLTWDRFEARMVEISHSQLILFWKTEPENCGWAKKEKKKVRAGASGWTLEGKEVPLGPPTSIPRGQATLSKSKVHRPRAWEVWELLKDRSQWHFSPFRSIASIKSKQTWRMERCFCSRCQDDSV